MMVREWIAVGSIRRPVGLAGFCSIEVFGAGFAAIETPCTIRIGRNSDHARETVITEIVERPDGYQCLFQDAADRTAAEALRGLLIFRPADSLPALAENEFYHHQLRGMRLYGDSSGTLKGTVIEVQNMPSMDTLEVALERGGSVILPLTAQAIVRIDREAGRIIVREAFVEELLE
ncbi:MAG: 16S rRNA processing protein RimM [Chitinispirillaceae bacterium]|nr:16S rRNA processing protein RimM [Chitinispirillaceae bacterium]